MKFQSFFCHCQIVDYIVDGSLSSETPSDSDSDDEDALIFKLWAYPRQISEWSSLLV